MSMHVYAIPYLMQRMPSLYQLVTVRWNFSLDTGTFLMLLKKVVYVAITCNK